MLARYRFHLEANKNSQSDALCAFYTSVLAVLEYPYFSSMNTEAFFWIHQFWTELFESVVDCRLILVSKHSHLEVDVVSSIGILRLSQSLLPFKPILPLGLIFLQFCLHYHIQFLRFNICVCFKISSVLAYTLR
jgi:hypothetical protein